MKDFFSIDVLISVPLNTVFTYKSNFKTKIGSVVKIPFGNNNEIVKGVVITKPYDKKRNFQIKEIISVENYESILSNPQLELLNWSSTYYLVGLPKIFNSIFSKNILDINLDKLSKEKKIKRSNNYKTNLVIDHSKNIIFNIIKEIKSKRYNKQILILCPNSYKTQSTYNILSKKYTETYIYDSKTTSKDKLKIWKDILLNKKIIIIGSKSAVYLPFIDLQKIYVIYEHNYLYKETDRVLRFNARDCAVVLSKIHKCDIDLITDSPSLESMYNTKKNKFNFNDKSKKLKLKTDLKSISIYNKLENKLKNKIEGIISLDILNRIKKNYDKKQKSIVFTPYSGDIDEIESSLIKSNSNYKILSISKTSTITRNQIEKLFEKINEYDIIIGNYSVIDGLDQFNYNLLILIDPDKISSLSNYRSNEIYFQLIFKVIKKVNFDDKKVIIQLSKSDSSELKDIIRFDYFKIISKEMEERKLFDYSPFKRLISLELSSKKKENTLSKGEILFNEIKNKFNFCDITNVGLVKSKGKILYKIYLKLDRVRNLRKNKKTIYQVINKVNRKKEFNNNLITIDVDP
jgi:primosomal protein N' (replication factor Y)